MEDGAVRDRGSSEAQSFVVVRDSRFRSAMAFEFFTITGMKDVLQVHSFQIRSTEPSERARASGRVPQSESSSKASETMRQPETER